MAGDSLLRRESRKAYGKTITGDTALRSKLPLGATGQTGPTLIGAGYNLPTTLKLAPGQITTLSLTGLKTVLPSGFVKATTVPLPTTLAGISVTLNPNSYTESPVPLLSIQ